MRISLSNLSSCILIISFVVCSLSCIPQIRKELKPVPEKFTEELQKIEKPSDLVFTRYSLRQGDTVWKVSKKFGVSTDTIVQINQIADVRDLKTGQILLIPVSQKSQTPLVSPEIVKDQSRVSMQGFVWPVKNKILTKFGDYKNGSRNTGIDIEATLNEDVVAAKDGHVIVITDNSDSWGKTVVIEHLNNLHTWYAYNSAIIVNKGMRVKRGQVIAKAGQSGKAGRPKLHFKVFVNDKPVNPLIYLPR